MDSKKLHKYDGAFYSKKTMNINGGDKVTGVLNLKAENEGLDSELYLTINGGTITAQACSSSGDAGIDSDKGIYINGGKVIASGNMLDHIHSCKGREPIFKCWSSGFIKIYFPFCVLRHRLQLFHEQGYGF